MGGGSEGLETDDALQKTIYGGFDVKMLLYHASVALNVCDRR
jgi:hypothetical protein